MSDARILIATALGIAVFVAVGTRIGWLLRDYTVRRRRVRTDNEQFWKVAL